MPAARARVGLSDADRELLRLLAHGYTVTEAGRMIGKPFGIRSRYVRLREHSGAWNIPTLLFWAIDGCHYQPWSRPRPPQLDQRELQILTALAQGKRQYEIGRDLHLSPTEVSRVMQRAAKRTGCRNANHLLARCCATDLIVG